MVSAMLLNDNTHKQIEGDGRPREEANEATISRTCDCISGERNFAYCRSDDVASASQ
jgi:hypothetical protein